MTARRVATAQREAAQQMRAPPPAATPHITWGQLGCPKEAGLHLAAIVRGQFPGRAQGQEQDHVHIGVKSIHLMAAENDPAALFTVVTFHPPHGPAEYVLGHRVA